MNNIKVIGMVRSRYVVPLMIVAVLMVISPILYASEANMAGKEKANEKKVEYYGITPEILKMNREMGRPFKLPKYIKFGTDINLDGSERATTRGESDLLEDEWKLSNFYTIKDSFFFSYYPETVINLSDSQGNQIDSMQLGEGAYQYKALQAGTYFVNATERHSVLIGDPILDGVCGYSVIDDKGFGTFTNAYTYLPLHQFPGTERTIIWATKDNTQITVERMDTGQVIWQGVLNKGAHVASSDWASIHIHINATEPVQCLVYFDSGYFLPSTDGLFAGKEFYGYVGMVGGWNQDINIFSYEPNTVVTVKDDAGGVVWSGTLGQYQSHTITKTNQEFYFTVESNKNITVGCYPFASYDTGYYHLTFVADKTGSGIGNEILVGSMTGGYLYVFGYFDNTNFQVYNAETGQMVGQYTINKGEAIDVNPGHGLWRIVSDEKPISCLEGYMTFGSSFAWPLFGGARPRFDILPKPYPDGSTEPLVKYAKPGETITYNLTVVNRYERDDIVHIDLNVTCGNENWSAWLDTYEVTLGREEWQDIVLYVKAPTEITVAGDMAIVNVSGVMRENVNVTDTLATYTILEPALDFEVKWDVDEDLFTEKKTVTAQPGEQKIVNAQIVNIGYVNDTYDITLEGAPPGWVVSFDNSVPKDTMTVDLSNKYYYPDNGLSFPVFITPPETAMNNEMAVLTLTAVSRASGEYLQMDLERYDDLYVMISGKADLKLSCEDDSKYVNRGGTVSFDILVRNDGSTELSVTLSLSGNSQDTTIPQYDVWGAHLEVDQFTLGPNQKRHVALVVAAPENALADARLVSSVSARGVGSTPNGMVTFRAEPIQTTAIVLPAHEINASVSPGVVEVNAGQSYNVNISVTNNGNLIETVTPGIDLLGQNWNVTFLDEDGYEITTLSIDVGDEKRIMMHVEVPDGTIRDSDPETPEIDPYKVIVNLTAGNIYTLVSYTVRIGQVRDFQLSYFGDKSNDVRPGGTVLYPMRLENKGNWYDTVDIKVSGLEGDWIKFISSIDTSLATEKDVLVEYDRVVDAASYMYYKWSLTPNGTDFHGNVTVRLAPGQVVYVQVGIVVPSNADDRIYNFNVEASSTTGTEANPNDNELMFDVMVKIPNPFVSSVKMPDDVTEGELVTITAVVGNSGDIACENLNVQLVVDGKVVEEKEVVNIEPGKTAIVTFTWRVPSGGGHTIDVRVDPDNRFTEHNEKDNSKERTVTAKSRGLFTPGYDALLFLGALGAVFVASRRRRRA